jgi:hypothetical protein
MSPRWRPLLMKKTTLEQNNNKKAVFDINQKTRHVVYGSKDEALNCLAKTLVDAYLNKKRYESTKESK